MACRSSLHVDTFLKNKNWKLSLNCINIDKMLVIALQKKSTAFKDNVQYFQSNNNGQKLL